MKRIGYIYRDLNHKIRGDRALAFPLLNQLRLAVYVVILLCLRQYMVLQIVLVTTQSIFQMMWLGFYHPY